ncbi:MAG: hypothetical protein J1E00_08090 [Oscillospiraceae bacterium]|nr:hypothetical protein [Oscillospiraceae bacterium]
MERTPISQIITKNRTNVQNAIELLQKKRYLEAAREAAQARMDCHPPESAPWRECREQLLHAEEALAIIRCAYGALSAYQQDLLNTFFVEGEKYCADRLCERYYKERSTLYRDRKKALLAFTFAAFGNAE